MKIHASGEDYLEAILILQTQMGESAVRSVDLARYMGYSKPSISHAVGVLRNGSFLTIDENGFLHLTDTGRKVACKIEHAISEESFSKLKKALMEGGGDMGS